MELIDNDSMMVLVSPLFFNDQLSPLFVEIKTPAQVPTKMFPFWEIVDASIIVFESPSFIPTQLSPSLVDLKSPPQVPAKI